MKKLKIPKTRNRFEAAIFDQLKLNKVNFKYESEKIPYYISGHYNPDFIIITPTGKVYIEAKGYFRPEHKRKMAAVKKQHPELDIRLLFYRSTKKDIRWCEKNGFKYAFYNIPQDWLDGF